MTSLHRPYAALLAACLLAATPIVAVAQSTPTDGVRVAQKPAASKTAKKVRYANLVLSGAVPEGPGGAGPFAEMKTSLAKLVAKIDRAADDDSIEGMVLDLQNPQLGRGGVDEVRAAIKRFRESGKTVHAQLEMATPGDYLIACACDQIIMPESGLLVLPGVRAEGLFMKGLLSKVGIEADFLHMGDAKGAGETYTRDQWSEPVKKNLTAMVDDLYVQLYETIGLDRPVTEAQAREAVDQGVISAGEALKLGLIDRVAYPDEVRATLAGKHEGDKLVYVENYGAKKVDTDFSGPAGFFKLMGVLAGAGNDGPARGKKVAVVYAVGPIMTGKSESDLFGATTIGSTSMVEALDTANRDKDVVAIVLRVNSPGGSAIASDLIWRKIQQIEKPVIASMGDVAASGGYYISMGADKIIAEPQTVTGSIGVVSGKMALAGLYKKVGLSVDVISRGENSGIFSSTDKFTERERQAMLRMMEDVYGQFTSKAAEGRHMEQDKLLSLASGKVYTGRQAKENGLVDELGSLHDAVAEAKKMAGLKADEKVRIMTLPEQPDLFEELFGGGKQQREVSVRVEGLALPAGLREAVGRFSVWQRLLQKERVGLFMPVEIVVE
ncbi:Protease 4 [Posidoniimonas corsicana]|uniref:Protease 4 n=1 Tax=Posidoniimonas corsicana TaxID=1938618 RepID=A0A5C5VFF6_9BACT|nr:signal peptide peptidase SppA [Posidoniimonas corsicana]TWT36831.1 Protease 4 [Posidoniimonas corsicana]